MAGKEGRRDDEGSLEVNTLVHTYSHIGSHLSDPSMPSSSPLSRVSSFPAVIYHQAWRVSVQIRGGCGRVLICVNDLVVDEVGVDEQG